MNYFGCYTKIPTFKFEMLKMPKDTMFYPKYPQNTHMQWRRQDISQKGAFFKFLTL